jgi:hypothetical protein
VVLPSFKYRNTKKGILFSTYPLNKELIDGDENLIHTFNYDDGIKERAWHPNVEFIFYPINNKDRFVEYKLKKQGRNWKNIFENNHEEYSYPFFIYPITKGDLMLDTSYFPDLAGAKIYWGILMSDIEFDNSIKDLKKTILFPFEKWWNQIGGYNTIRYYESIIDNMEIDDEYWTHEVIYKEDSLSYGLLNYILSIDYIKLKIINLKVIELYFLTVSRFYTDKTLINTYEYRIETNRSYEIRYTKEFPKELINFILKNRIRQVRPDGVKWKETNEIGNDKGDSDFCYYAIEDLEPIFVDKYFSKTDNLSGYLTMFKKSDLFLNKINVVMTEHEIDQESKDDRDYYSKDSSDDWMENPEDYWNID